jgi:hypothetical protein
MKTIKTLAALSLIIAAIFTFSTPGSKADALTDIQDHQFQEAIEYAQVSGIVNGYPDGTFKPDNSINRAEFTKILIEAKFTANDYDNCHLKLLEIYSDMQTDDHWYNKYVCLATAKGLVKGYPNGSFRPDAKINFAEAAKIIANTYSQVAIQEDQEIWYYEYVKYLAIHKAIPTTITSFDQLITRGEMTEMIYRLEEHCEIEPLNWQVLIKTGTDLKLVEQKQDSINEPCEPESECSQALSCSIPPTGQSTKCGTIDQQDSEFVLITQSNTWTLQPQDGGSLNTLTGFIGQEKCIIGEFTDPSQAVDVLSAGMITDN